MTDRELMQQALEALEEIALAGMSVAPEMLDEKEAFHARQAWRFIGIAARALESVKKARAEQPERDELQAKGEHPAPCARHCEANAFQIVIKNLQAQLAQPEQEPVAKDWRHVIPGRRHTDQWDSARIADYNQGWNDCQKKTKTELEKLYTSPPASKPLTDEECDDLWAAQLFDITDRVSARDFIRDVEAAHGIKENT